MTNGTELTISRLIKAPPSAVWNAWSVPENLEKWWIPAPIECRVDTLEREEAEAGEREATDVAETALSFDEAPGGAAEAAPADPKATNAPTPSPKEDNAAPAPR